jgi:NADP-dependent 3-hydroxy acid dehydrogenase YdfG
MSSPVARIGLITGSSSGIGRAIALRLASRLSTMILAGRDAAALAAIAAEVASQGCEPVCECVNMAVSAEVTALAARVRSRCERMDLLVHSAGRYSRGQVEDVLASELDVLYQVNLRAPYVLTQALVPLLRAARGDIVVINSSLGQRSGEQVSQYAATKHGLKAIADGLRDEVNGDGVRVLSVFTGRTATRMQHDVHVLEEKVYTPEKQMQPDDIAQMVLAAISLPRTAEVTDIHIRPATRA